MQWTFDWPASVDLTAEDPELVAQAEALAAATMRMLTLYRVGGNPIVVMPTGRTCTSPIMRREMFSPTVWFPSAAALKACNCVFGCGCAAMAGVYLTAPVGDIISVSLNGELLDPAAYRVEDGERLIRTDGAAWPVCAGKDFTVTYLNGHPIDAMGAYAGGVMAAEWLSALKSDKKCRLSSRVTSVNRQGIAMELTPGMFPDGVTGIEEVDLYIRIWNPHGWKVAPKVYTVDKPRQREVTWGAI